MNILLEIIALEPQIAEKIPTNQEERLMKLAALQTHKNALNSLQKNFLKYAASQIDKDIQPKIKALNDKGSTVNLNKEEKKQ